MPRVAPEDTPVISHITYVTDSVHKFGDELYEDLMDRDNDSAKEKAQLICKLCAEIIQSLTHEI